MNAYTEDQIKRAEYRYGFLAGINNWKNKLPKGINYPEFWFMGFKDGSQDIYKKTID